MELLGGELLGGALPGGVLPASVTPFDEKGRIDFPALARLLAHFRAEGCSGVVLAGTNGEGPSLSAVERRDLVKQGVALSGGLPIVLGIATPSLEEAVWLSRQAKDAGAAGVLVMPPAYFREAPEEGIARWFEALLERTDIGIIGYNFPKRTGIALSPELLNRLGKHPRFVGVKDSSGEAANLPSYAQALPEKKLYIGDETLLLDALRAGWTGSISGAANVLPRWLSQVVADFPSESAEVKFQLILPKLRQVRALSQPYAHKAILHREGILPRPDLRLPLLPPNVETDLPDLSI